MLASIKINEQQNNSIPWWEGDEEINFKGGFKSKYQWILVCLM